MASLRGTQQPELSKKLYKIIKTENHVIGAHEAAAREQVCVARQLSEWGEATEDETISEVSDKLGVLMAEIAEQEDLYAQALEDYRGVLKQIRNTESSVQPSRDHKAKVRLWTSLGAVLTDAACRFQTRSRSSSTRSPKAPRLFSLNRSLCAQRRRVWSLRRS